MSLRVFTVLLLMAGAGVPSLLGAGPPRFRAPAPLEDAGPQVRLPVFGRAARHEGTDATLGVMEWVAKRTWHVLGLPFERKDFTAPELPRDKRFYLAFGGVSDEVCVHVNETKCYESPLGDNIRHERFLVDVTLHLKSGPGNCIAVRFWNTGWCGGIWKSVKLVSRKREEA